MAGRLIRCTQAEFARGYYCAPRRRERIIHPRYA